MRHLISNYVNEESLSEDLSLTIMDTITNKPTSAHKINKKIVILVAALMLFSTFAYAAVEHMIDLHTESSDQVKSIIVNDFEFLPENHFEFEDFSVDYVPNKPVMTINTKSPLDNRISRGEYEVYSYEEMTKQVKNEYVLPEQFDDFVFNHAVIGYRVHIPTDEFLFELAKKHEDEDFYTFELEYEGPFIEWYEYTYDDTENAQYRIHLTPYVGERSYYNNQLTTYEVVPLETTEAILMLVDNMSAIQQEDKILNNEITNNYQMLWQEGDNEYMIQPSHQTRIYPDFKNHKNIFYYPDHTKDHLIILAQALNRIINK